MSVRANKNEEREALDRVYYPRVLIVNGEPPTECNATGLTLIELFKNWPTDKLACIYTSTKASIPTESPCVNNWFVSKWDMFFCRAGASITPESDDDQSGYSTTSRKPTASKRLSMFDISIMKKSKLFGMIRLLSDLGTYKISVELDAWITKFSPEIVYSMLGSNRIMKLSIDICDRTAAKLVPHFMDDWITTKYYNTLFSNILRARLNGLLLEVLSKTSEGFTIGETMAIEYKRRYSIRFTHFMKSVEAENWPIVDFTAPDREILKMVYVGGLHLHRKQALIDIGLALQLINLNGLRAELYVYTHDRDLYESREMSYLSPSVRVESPLKPSEVPPVLQDADILVHVESFLPEDRLYTRFSVSTKIPEYMISGRPILAYGPSDGGSLVYINKVGCGIVVTSRSKEELVLAVNKMLISNEFRVMLGQTGRNYAIENHNGTFQRNLFHSSLVRIANRNAMEILNCGSREAIRED